MAAGIKRCWQPALKLPGQIEAMLGRVMQLTTAQMTDRQRSIRDAERDRQKAADMLREHALRWGAGAAREADNVSDGRGTEKPPDKPD